MEKSCRTCQYDLNTRDKNSPCYSCGDGYTKFKFILQYKLTEKYKNGFSLIDIAKKKPCWDEFNKLLQAETRHHSQKFSWCTYWKEKIVNKANISWLIEKGFIEDNINFDRCFRCGSLMSLEAQSANRYTLVCTGRFCPVMTISYSSIKSLKNHWNKNKKVQKRR